ncbi:MAG TPA: beta-propeller fold lactonase family protein [Gemmatimonadaceae bacterium]
MLTRSCPGRWRSAASSLLAVTTLTLAACSDSNSTAPLAAPADASLNRSGSQGPSDDRRTDRAGAVYTETNGVDGNAIVAFRRATDGSLTRLASFATGGKGIGGTVDPLTSQYSVILDDDHRSLFAVDAGSNRITSFHVNENGGLIRIGSVSSNGVMPISLATKGALLYVLNTGDNSLSGYLVIGNALLLPLPHSTRKLAEGANGAAAIRFTRDGRRLIVSERVSNRFEVFPVQFDGRLGDPVVSPAVGGASFGFDVTDRNQPIVSETQGSLTSYALSSHSALTPITSSISTGGAAACWVTILDNGRFAYSTNAGSNFVAGFGVDNGGHLSALNPGGKTGDVGAGATPIDLDHVESNFLYTLEAARGTIGAFAIHTDGSLTARADTHVGAGSSGLQGIAAF